MNMNNSKTVTCSFTMDRDVYDEYKSIVVKNHQSVKGNLIEYMMNVIRYNISNADTIEAIKEVDAMKKDPSLGKSYTDVDKMMEELLA